MEEALAILDVANVELLSGEQLMVAMELDIAPVAAANVIQLQVHTLMKLKGFTGAGQATTRYAVVVDGPCLVATVVAVYLSETLLLLQDHHMVSQASITMDTP